MALLHDVVMECQLAWLGQAVEIGLPRVRTLVTVTTLGGSRLVNRVLDRVESRISTLVD